jgi:hypothetical protein
MTDAAIIPCPGCGAMSSEDYDGAGTCWPCYNGPAAVDQASPEPAATEQTDRADMTSQAPAVDSSDLPKATFPLLSIADLAELPPPSWLLHNMLPASTFNVLFGPSNVGKSFLALDWALCIAAGLAWYGQRSEQGTVVYIAGEGVAGLYRRVQAWTHARNQPAPEPIRFIPNAANFLDDQDVLRATITIADMPTPPRLIVVDTMARCMVGGDENSAKDVGRFIDAVDELRTAHGAATLVVHHTGKDGEDERGSSALRGAADAMLALKSDGASARLECIKQKDAAPFDPWRLHLENVLESCVLRCGSNTTALAPTESRILEEVSAAFGTDYVSASQLQKACTVPESSYFRSRKSLLERGFIEVTGDGRSARYRLTADGHARALSPTPTDSHESDSLTPTTTPLYGGVGVETTNGTSNGPSDINPDAEPERLAAKFGEDPT